MLAKDILLLLQAASHERRGELMTLQYNCQGMKHVTVQYFDVILSSISPQPLEAQIWTLEQQLNEFTSPS